MLSRAQHVINSFSKKIVSSALSARMALSQISLTRAKLEVGAKRAFTEKKPFISLNCTEKKKGGSE